ncbi:Sporulation membrane protein YtrI [Paraliobacillus sp. PM-2]|uniref:sporulation membrane protein YtrI n=1 Tax=Paraliobacillus sp. PM-2 TaxID=1462524 RepID=UPI00061C320D|nr:sporulation membrane protein YtrI [Paraliobacillus sp. PM-2]CQR48122.1 Sporulation membrane protein YtrI [Paraliobacillus sp. PM-2]
MHIPPYYKRESWQRFLAGTFAGAIIAFFVFVYMYGQLYEGWVEENLELRAQLQEIKSNYKALEESNKELDQRYQQKATVSSIEINISNQKQLNLDRLIIREFEEVIKKEINEVIGKEVDDLSENYSFLIRTIENKTYEIHDFSYQAKVQHLFVTEKLEAHIKLTIAN